MFRRKSEPHRIDVASRQIIGKRAVQQDRMHTMIAVNSESSRDQVVIALADGMGGHAAGEVAAEIAIHASINEVSDKPFGENIDRVLRDAVRLANKRIAQHIESLSLASDMGTTLVVCLVEAKKAGAMLKWVSIGDSPLWIWRASSNNLIRVNADHSIAGELDRDVLTGKLSAEQASSDPRAKMGHVLTLALSGRSLDLKAVDLPNSYLTIDRRDIIILASDGVESLHPEEICQTIQKNREESAETICESILKAIEHLGMPSQDNASLIVVKPPT